MSDRELREIRSDFWAALKDVLQTGAVLAMIISWELHHSILWAVLHGACSWFYVIYYYVTLAG